MKLLTLAFALLVLATGCVAATGTEVSDQTTGDLGKADGTDWDFAFAEHSPDDYTVQVDHLGLSLVTTVLHGRSDDVNCRGVDNQLGLLALADGLVRIHRMWRDDIERAGYPTCAMELPEGITPTGDNIWDLLETTQCTAQRVERVLPSGERVGGLRVLDLTTPDFATVNVDEPGGFPNGRAPFDQVTDLILAMGMVDLSDGMTVDQVHLNPQHNDVELPTGFPYLAPAHEGLPGAADDVPDYWE